MLYVTLFVTTLVFWLRPNRQIENLNSMMEPIHPIPKGELLLQEELISSPDSGSDPLFNWVVRRIPCKKKKIKMNWFSLPWRVSISYKKRKLQEPSNPKEKESSKQIIVVQHMANILQWLWFVIWPPLVMIIICVLNFFFVNRKYDNAQGVSIVWFRRYEKLKVSTSTIN